MNSEIVSNRKFDYKWIIVGISFVLVMVCLGFCSGTKSLFIAPITSALGIERSAFSGNDSCRYIATAIINIFFGSLVKRFGPKKLIVAGIISLIASQLVYSLATNVFVFYIGGILLGIGIAWTTTTMVGCVVNKWFKEKTGTIMGIILAANGLGSAIAIQIITPIIESNAFGYRNAYRLTAIILAALCVLVVIFFKNKPKNSQNDEDVVHKKKRGRVWNGISYKQAIKMPYFYAAAACIFFTGFVLQGVVGVAAAHMRDVGLDPTYIGTVLSIHSLVLTAFKFLTGYFYDKFGLRTTMNICSITAVVVMVFLCMITDSVTGKIFAMIYGIFSSLALPLETIMLPIYAGDLFGQRSFNRMLGIFVSVNTAGYALGAPFLNMYYDLFHSYNSAFIICAVVMAIVIITLQFVVKEGHRQLKLAQEAQA